MAKNIKFTLVAWGGEDLIDYLAITGQLQRLLFDDGDTTIELRNPYEGLPVEKKAEIIRALLKASHQQPTRRKKWWETAIPQEEAERIDRIVIWKKNQN